jgi:DNA-directed RNA polymerase specialized sigma24 family protein
MNKQPKLPVVVEFVLNLKDDNKWTFKEIAKYMGTSPETASMRYKKAKSLLQKQSA